MGLSKRQILSCAGIGRINPYRVAELLDGMIEIPQLNKDHAEIIMRISVWGS